MKIGDNSTSGCTERPEDQVRRLAERQFGVVSRSQVLGAGISGDVIVYRVRSRHWRRVLPSVYAIGGAPSAWPQPLMAGLLWAGPSAVVSHRAAAALWKLDGVEAGLVELTATQRRSKLPSGVLLHFSSEMTRSEFGQLGRFRVTGLARTVLDLASVLSDTDALEAAAESAARLDEALWGKLAHRLKGEPLRGHRGVHILRDLLAARDPGAAPTESMFETRLLRLIRAAGLEEPVRQLVIPVTGVPTPRVDFAYPEQRVVIEADGYWCHSGRRRWMQDLRRGNALVVEGWRPIHVTWQDLVTRPDEIAASIRQALAGPPSP